MVHLIGKSLNERQKELNFKINEAVANKVDFEDVKSKANPSDVDMLYKIDVASRYKNIEYIFEVLKGGDSLYISRALKSTWLRNDEFSDVINTDYLDHNIFPFMSLKMKRKFLTTISMHLRNDRAASFYTYCINAKLYNIALKFLVFTSESFKLDVIKQYSISSSKIFRQDGDYMSFLIGNSFILAKAYLEVLNECQRTNVLYQLRYLFSVSDIEYLNLLEKYEKVDEIKNKLGLRISKQILVKHKERILHTPLLYMKILNKTTISKYLTVDVAKQIAVKLLPLKVGNFWSDNYCTVYDFILNIIPAAERFQWLKSIFVGKYPAEEFEMSKQFFDSKCYTFMTLEEREAWALRHIESKKEIQGDGRDYLWYKFVSFEVTFPEIKKYVAKTKDAGTRAEVINVLIESARNERDLEKLLTYFHSRHLNESRYMIKEIFITEIINFHNIFNFDNDSWVIFNKILYSLDIYNIRGQRNNFITLYALIYHIIHKMDIPESLEYIIEHQFHWSGVDWDQINSKINKDDQKRVYEYLFQFYTDKMEKGNSEDQDYKKAQAKSILNLLHAHKKSINDCPEVVKNYVDSNWKVFSFECYNLDLIYNFHKFAEGDLLRYLKQDAKIVIDKMPNVRRALTDERYNYKMNQFLRKIKIYFPDDVAKDYQTFFMNIISERDLSLRCVYNAVYGIFQLADEQFKEQFMMQYVPSNPKIDYTELDTQTLYIQGGICRYACFSRPPVPLSNILMYIKGDYVQHCLPIFNTFLANLPTPLCMKFIESIIKSPVSIQKHGIRVAFKSFSAENLKKLVHDIWNKSTNLSLRAIIYRALYNRITVEDEITQLQLFETLKLLIFDLREDDLGEIFSDLTTNKLSDNLLGQYIEVGWQTVNKFKDNPATVKRKKAVITNIEQNLAVLDTTFVSSIVEEHISDQLVKGEIKNSYEIVGLENLNAVKWELVAAYLTYFTSDNDVVTNNIELAKLIMKKCIEMWNTVKKDIFILRRFCWNFIDSLVKRQTSNGSYENVIPIYETVLLILQDSLPLRVIYSKCWLLRLTILNRQFAQASKLEYDKEAEKNKRIRIVKDTVKKIAVEIGELIKKSVHNKEYFSTVSGMQDMICSNIKSIKCAIDINGDIGMKDLYVSTVDGLIQTDTHETYLLAVCILPVYNIDDWDEEYESLVTKMKAYDNEEVQICLYDKFINSKFKKWTIDFDSFRFKRRTSRAHASGNDQKRKK